MLRQTPTRDFLAARVWCLTQILAGNNSPERHESKGTAQLAGRQHRVDQLEKTGRKKERREIQSQDKTKAKKLVKDQERIKEEDESVITGCDT